jgi:hypothetical protein
LKRLLLANDDVAAAEVSVVVGADGSVTTEPLSDEFVRLDGRPGGQTIHGSDNASGILTLRSQNPNVYGTSQRVQVENRFRILGPASIVAGAPLDIDMSASTVSSGSFIFERLAMPAALASGSQFTAFQITGATLAPGAGVPFQLFNFAFTQQFQASRGAGQVFFFAPTFDDDGSVRTVGVGIRMFIVNPNFAALTPGSVGTPGTYTIIDTTPVVDASWNPIPALRFISFTNPGGTHAAGITDLVGMEVPDAITKPTNVFTIRNLEDRAKMVHRGAMSVGDLAVTVPPAGIELEVRSAIGVLLNARLTNAQIAALPAVPDGSQVYCTDAGVLAIGMHQMLGGAWVAM